MISVVKDFSNPPAGLALKGCIDNIKLTLSEKNDHKFSGYYYRDKVIAELRLIYNNKCAYCETLETAGSTLRVDHYRPKDKVQNTDPIYDGYYWLGYEWSNLILACEKCNRIKSNQFPLEDESLRIVCKPVVNPNGLPNKWSCRSDLQYLQIEKPLLLNPELHKVEDHLIFKPDGTIKDLTDNGRISIKLYDLDRENLNIARKKLVDKVVSEIKKLLADFLEGQIDTKNFHYCINIVYLKMLSRMSPSSQYSRMAYFVFNKFNFFIVNRFEFEGQREIISKTYKLFQENKLWPFEPDIVPINEQ